MPSVLCQMLRLQNNVPKKICILWLPFTSYSFVRMLFFPILHNVMTVEGVITLAR